MNQTADVIFGLGFGDEGKGQTVCRVAHERFKTTGSIPAVVRYSGGCQNSHNVVWSYRKYRFLREYHHEHSQIGAVGPLSFKSFTYTWKVVPFDIQTFIREAITLCNIQSKPFWPEPIMSLNDILSRQFIHEDCLWMVSPLHEYVSRMRDNQVKHGSTGRGIYEVNKFAELFPKQALRIRDMITLLTSNDLSEIQEVYRKGDLFLKWVREGMEVTDGSFTLKTKSPEQEILEITDSRILFQKFKLWLRKFLDNREEVTFLKTVISEEEMISRMKNHRHLVFEGGQGVMLDMDFGFFPNVTFSKAVPVTAKHLIERLGIQEENTEFIGVTRYYSTRHGAGYLPVELSQDGSTFETLNKLEKHNRRTFQGDMRFGKLSADTLLYAVSAVENSGIIINRIHWTHADIQDRIKSHVILVDPIEATRIAHAAKKELTSDINRREIINNWMGSLKSRIPVSGHIEEPNAIQSLINRNTSEGCRVEIFN